ncbi:HPr family phosphocarrier protein [Marisediminicola senii]|uniref:HPr family phosphocarrier protein n=1 Tax=Marisediminicola senii TaxID=2711233 RepID=UPI0013EB97CB|nr:HPr family phosphocarrier protein [Marisediminicola senii]
MPERSVVVASALGLHARPAAVFSRAAASVPVVVTVTNAGGRGVPAASILGVLSLGVSQGDEVTLSAEGDGADAALDSLVELLGRELDDDE